MSLLDGVIPERKSHGSYTHATRPLIPIAIQTDCDLDCIVTEEGSYDGMKCCICFSRHFPLKNHFPLFRNKLVTMH